MDAVVRDWARQQLGQNIDIKDIQALLSHPKHGNLMNKMFNLLVNKVASKEHVDRLHRAKVLQAEKKEVDSMLIEASNVSEKYISARDQSKKSRSDDISTYLDDHLQESYLAILGEAMNSMANRLDSSHEKQDCSVQQEVEQLISPNSGPTHEEKDGQSVKLNGTSAPNSTISPLKLMKSIEDKVGRINVMLNDLDLMASDVANGNDGSSVEQLRSLLDKLQSHECQLGSKKQAECDNFLSEDSCEADILSMMNQLMHLEESCVKYERERKEVSQSILSKMCKVRSGVEQ